MDLMNHASDAQERASKLWTASALGKVRKLVGVAAALPLLALLLVVPSVSGRDTHSSSDGSREAREATPIAGNYLAILKGRVDLESGIVRLAASRDGIIREILVNEGDHVSKGQVLATLDDTQARLELEQARRELNQRRAELQPLRLRLAAAQREHARLVPLASDESVARQELDLARDQLALLKAEMAVAQTVVGSALSREKVAAYEVEQRQVRAPLDGQVVRRYARPGDGISTLNVTALFVFAPDSPQIVRAEIEERFVDAVRPGMAAQIVPQADETRVFSGKVLRVGRIFGQPEPTDDPTAKADIRTVECVLSIDQQTLRVGQRVLIRIPRS